jgi:carbonic anhydrase
MEEHHLGLVDNWLCHVRDVYASNKDEIEKIPDKDARMKWLVELNVHRQVLNICHTTIVQVALGKKQPLFIHSWVYDMADGHIKDLNYSFSNISELEGIYKVKPIITQMRTCKTVLHKLLNVFWFILH